MACLQWKRNENSALSSAVGEGGEEGSGRESVEKGKRAKSEAEERRHALL